MTKKICIALCGVLAVTLALLLWHERKTEKETAAICQEMSEETSPLSVQAQSLEQQIRDLESEAAAGQAGTATTQFLVTDLSAKSYKKVISPLADTGYPAGLALSFTEFPGAEGCLTAKEARTLAEQGWYFCYAYDAEEAAELYVGTDAAETADAMTDAEAAEALLQWLSAVEEEALAQGLKMETAVYFPSGSFREGFAGALKEKGIRTVIHDGELGAGLLDAGEEDGLWYAGSAWWRGNEVLNSKLSAISGDGGELVTRMGVDSGAADTLEEWMERFESVVDGKSIEVTDFSEMAEIQTENASAGTGLSEDTKTRIAELQAQKEELQAQIAEIQDRYLEQIRSLGQ